MIKLDTKLDVDIAGFFDWWKRELAFMVPTRLRALGQGQSNHLFLRVVGFEVELTWMSDKGTETIGRFTLDNKGAAKLKKLFEERTELKASEHILLLGRLQAIRKTLTLPAATEENLQQVISYELDRFTPFKPEQLYYAFTIVGRNRASNQIIVELICTPKWKLESLYKEMSRLEFQISSIRFYDAALDKDFVTGDYNLLPQAMRPKINKGPKYANIVLAVCLLGLIVTVLVLPVILEQRIESELIDKIKVAQKKAKEIELLQNEAGDILGNAEKVVKIKKTIPSMIIVLDELTKIIPDNTWLKNFQYSNGRLQIQGISSSASALIAILEASILFKNTSFVSPVTQDRATGLERFQIATQLAGYDHAG